MRPDVCFARYLGFTILYGGLHAAWSGRTQSKHTDSHTYHPTLVTHRLARIMCGCFMGPSNWPFMMYDDLTTAECRLRGTDPAHYGKMFTILDWGA